MGHELLLQWQGTVLLLLQYSRCASSWQGAFALVICVLRCALLPVWQLLRPWTPYWGLNECPAVLAAAKGLGMPPREVVVLQSSLTPSRHCLCPIPKKAQ
jgi:hypothetical protein